MQQPSLPRPLLSLMVSTCLAFGGACGSAHDACDGLPEDVALVDGEMEPYPTQSAFFGHGHDRHAHCRRPHRGFAWSDYVFFRELARVPLGSDIPTGAFTKTRPENWENMGFVAAGAGRWRRVASLDGVAELVPTRSAKLPEVDAIVITSIDRRNGRRPYIYDTLASLFAVLPDGAQVNIVVGDDDDAYLAPERLEREGLSARQVRQIHVHPASPEDAGFLGEVFIDSVRRRAAWNYARALRSYRGTRGLLLLEDDVRWATHALEHFGRLQADDPLPVVSLFDHECDLLPDPRRNDLRAGRRAVAIRRPEMRKVRFYCTQAMYYSVDVAGELGRYLQARMHEDGYDAMVHRFLHRHGVQLGYAAPSLVQHTGHDSTGLSVWIPSSRCFVPELPPALWADEVAVR